VKKILPMFRTRFAVFAHDLVAILVAWFGAYVLRFNLDTPPDWALQQAIRLLPMVFVVQTALFWHFGLYKGVWRFASLPDLVRISKAVGMGLLVIWLVMWLADFRPRSVFLLYGILLLGLLGGPRFLYRWFKDHGIYHKPGKRVVIVGAGRAGEMLVRDLLRQENLDYQPVAFVDDDPGKSGREIHGFPVVGKCDLIPSIVDKESIDLVLIAMPSASAEQMRAIVEICERSGVEFRTLPSMQDMVSGKAVVGSLRAVSIEDLLGREPVSLEWGAIRNGLAGKTVLVTGGGGSIGSELCRQISELQPKHLVILESSEFNLYTIEKELGQRFPQLQLSACLGSVVDTVLVDHVFKQHRPDVVFHAAAYKHVPMLEGQTREAITNNIFGTRCVAEAADRYKAGQFVLISTDKAVNPTNIMGASKRAAEIFCQNFNRRSPVRFITVRFGNVLDSAGSVVPLFRQQIENGGPVTVTHPDIKRFFMTIPEASLLILQAGIMGKGGEIFVLDMGEPIKISYLAEQMIRLSGKVPGDEIEIVYSGLRPGEKLFEELFYEQEPPIGTAHEKIFLAKYREVDWEKMMAKMAAMQQACDDYDNDRLDALLKEMVPEFIRPGDEMRVANVVPFKKWRQ